MTTQLIKKWIEENPQASHSFYVDVVYNLYMNDSQLEQLSIRSLERINTWFYHYNKTVWVFSKRNNQYELKQENECCFVIYSPHSLDKAKERVVSYEFVNLLKNKSIKSILINNLSKNNVISGERILLVLVDNNKKIGYILKLFYNDYLLKTIVVITVLGHKRKYYNNGVKHIEITLKKKIIRDL